MSAAPDIFLSYNREDQAVAKLYAEAFAAEGLDVWWDTALRSGEAYDEVTEAALRGAKAVVVLWSPRSVVSRWVRAEATIADRCKTLVPVTIEPCERPIMFELTQTADLAHWTGDAQDRAWLALLGDVRGFVERSKAAALSVESPPSTAAGIDAGRPSLAILPFTNRSGEASDDAFAEGMVEDLIAALSTAGDMRVVANSATRRYRDGSVDVRQIGSELDVRYLLEGNLRRSGNDLRVTAQLVEASSGSMLWSQKFDRSLAELAVLQEDLVLEVAGYLGVQVISKEIERALAKPGDITAWELLARSGVLTAAQTPGGMRKGLIDVRQATELAPTYALAHAFRALLAALHYWQVGGGDAESMRAEARASAERAILLDRNDPKVLNNVAMALCVTGAWKEGLRAAERAYQINPHLEASHQAMAMVCMYFNRGDEAIEHLDACLKLAPGAPGVHVRHLQKAGAHFIAGRYYKAVQCTEQCLTIMPGFMFALKDLVIYFEKLGQREEAFEALRDLREHWPDLTLEGIALLHKRSLLPPDVAEEMQQTLAIVWQASEEASA
jgi:TolB-like protein/Tfp pilus assembly protein PilF